MAAMLFTACASFRSPPERSQLEIRQIQTRDFDVADTKVVLKAMLNVLQDEGYMIQSANTDLGLLTAKKETDLNRSSWTAAFGGKEVRWEKTSVTEMTANISPYDKGSRVRATFSRKILDNMGDVMSVDQIDNDKFYQDFFSKVDKGLFLQKENL